MESFWDIFNIPLGWLLRVCYGLIPNYGVALILFALIIKVLFFPFSIKQQKNSIRQAKLQPRERAIRKKYAGRNDKVTQEKVQREINELYQKENYNPLAGCLPMLIQLPLLLFVFNVIRSPLRYLCGLSSAVVNTVKEMAGVDNEISALNAMKADFAKFEGIEGISGKLTLGELPNFDIFGLDMSVTPNGGAAIYLLIPLLTFFASYFSSKIIRKFSYQPQQTEQNPQTELSMKIMNLTLPLFSVWIAYTVPAVVGIYWMYQNLLGILQQFILSKMYPIPTFTEEDYRQAELQIKGKPDKKKKKKTELDPNRPRVRSLHHIDDEEYNAHVVDEPQSSDGAKVKSAFIEPVKTKDYSDGKKNGTKK